MGRTYAGILGPLAMTIVICRGWWNAGGVQGTLTAAILSLAAFGVLGAMIGHIAQNTVDESVRTTLEQQLTHRAAPAEGATA